MINGFGDEFTYLVGTLILTTLMFIYFYSSNQNVVPSNNQAMVFEARERINGRNVDQVVDDPCPICLDDIQFRCSTNCGHHFCSSCMIAYAETVTSFEMLCPCCRRKITVLDCHFSNAELANENHREKSDSIYEINRRFGPRTFFQKILDAPILVRYFLRSLFHNSATTLNFVIKLRMIICLLMACIYFISPLDLIPESIFGIFGFIDDLIVVIFILVYVSIVYFDAISRRGRAYEMR